MDHTPAHSQASSISQNAPTLPPLSEPLPNPHRVFWNKMQLYMKLFMTTFVILLIIFTTVRQLFHPINGGLPEEPLQKILSILDSLDADLRQFPRILPLADAWNGTHPLN